MREKFGELDGAIVRGYIEEIVGEEVGVIFGGNVWVIVVGDLEVNSKYGICVMIK